MKVKVWAALLAVYLVWGSTYLMIRFVVETLPPFLSAGLRFVVSGVILLAWRRLAGDAAHSERIGYHYRVHYVYEQLSQFPLQTGAGSKRG